MANPLRGEITATLDGEERTLVLTLGALAELEQALGTPDLAALVDRFSQGKLSAREAIQVIGAGLRGAGACVTDQQVARMRAEGAAVGFITIVVRLVVATFTDANLDREMDSGGPPSNPRTVPGL